MEGHDLVFRSIILTFKLRSCLKDIDLSATKDQDKHFGKRELEAESYFRD